VRVARSAVGLSTVEKRMPLQWERHWFGARYREMILRLGSSQKARLRWLVERMAAQPNQPPPPLDTTELVSFALLQSGAGSHLATMPRVRSAGLNELTHRVSEGLALFVDGQPWKIEVRELIDRVLERRAGVRGVDQDEPYGARSSWQARSVKAVSTRFLLGAADLVERQQRWLSRCRRQDCRRIFVRNHQRQNYCSKRCSQTSRTRRFRAN
jgi:hypothetical protein